MSTPGATAVTIREARLEDAALLARLGSKTFEDAFAAQNTAEDMAAYLAAAFGPAIQAAEIADGTGVFLVAEAGGAALGYARLRRGETPGAVTGSDAVEIERLYVLQECKGTGVAASLMQACLDRALADGHRTVWLGVWERNDRAVAFYRKWGFRVVGTKVFVVGSDPQTDFVMERAL
jgi:ribosomal protein S18 acetylase RimI-like enzyme